MTDDLRARVEAEVRSLADDARRWHSYGTDYHNGLAGACDYIASNLRAALAASPVDDPPMDVWTAQKQRKGVASPLGRATPDGPADTDGGNERADEVLGDMSDALCRHPWHENGQPLRPDEVDEIIDVVRPVVTEALS